MRSPCISLRQRSWMSIVTVDHIQTVQSSHHSVSLTTSISACEKLTPMWAIQACHLQWCVVPWLDEKVAFVMTSEITATDSWWILKTGIKRFKKALRVREGRYGVVGVSLQLSSTPLLHSHLHTCLNRYDTCGIDMTLVCEKTHQISFCNSLRDLRSQNWSPNSFL